MATLFQKFINWLQPKKKTVHIELDPESVKYHNTIRALANESAQLKAEKAKLQAEIGKLRESKKDIEEEEKVKLELNRQKQELQKKTHPEYFSLKNFFKKLLNDKNFRKHIGYYTWDREKKIAKFGDIGLAFNGEIFLLDDKKKIIMHGERLKDIFQSIPALKNDLKSFCIPLNLDKDLGYVENFMVWEAPELIPTEDGEFKYAKARKKPLYDYLKELREQIAEQQETIEELEVVLNKLHQENDELKIAQRIAENSAETARKELSLSEKRVSAIENEFRRLSRQLAEVTDTNLIFEDNIEKLENQIKLMREEAEREGVKLSDRKALELIQRIRRELVRDEPKIKQIEKIPEPIEEKS